METREHFPEDEFLLPLQWEHVCKNLFSMEPISVQDGTLRRRRMMMRRRGLRETEEKEEEKEWEEEQQQQKEEQDQEKEEEGNEKKKSEKNSNGMTSSPGLPARCTSLFDYKTACLHLAFLWSLSITYVVILLFVFCSTQQCST